MTELTREQIERIRNEYDHEGLEEICDMALAKKDAEQRAQRAEAECERLRAVVNRVHVMERALRNLVVLIEGDGLIPESVSYMREARKALSTPIPGGEYRNPLTGHRDQDPAAHPTPEQTDEEQENAMSEVTSNANPWGAEHVDETTERIAVKLVEEVWQTQAYTDFGDDTVQLRNARIMVGNHRQILKAMALCSEEPQQTGDALAALEEIEEAVLGAANHIQDSFDGVVEGVKGSATTDPLMRAHGRVDEVRRHLTASGVLGNCMYCDKPVRLREQAERHFSHATCEQREREFAEVMEGEKMQPCMGDFMRRIHELGIRDPSEIAKAASGVPYVPEPILELPDKWFHRADDNALPYSEARREQLRVDAGELRYEMQKALASAPAVPSGYKLVPVEPTEEMLEAAVSREIYDEIVGDGNRRNEAWTQYKAMIAAAPTDGRE